MHFGNAQIRKSTYKRGNKFITARLKLNFWCSLVTKMFKAEHGTTCIVKLTSRGYVVLRTNRFDIPTGREDYMIVYIHVEKAGRR